MDTALDFNLFLRKKMILIPTTNITSNTTNTAITATNTGTTISTLSPFGIPLALVLGAERLAMTPVYFIRFNRNVCRIFFYC